MKTEKKPFSPWKRLILLLLAALVLAGAVVFFLCRGLPVLQKKRAKLLDTVLEGAEVQLKNSEFAFYYWNEYMYCLGSDAVPPFDLSVPLAEQNYDATMTWQDYLVSQALVSAEQTLAFVQAAKEEGFSLPQTYQDSLAQQIDNCTQKAAEAGLSTDAYLVTLYGEGVNEAGFCTYLEQTHMASAYTDYLYDSFEFTEEQIDDYYRQNKELFSGEELVNPDVHPCTLACIFLMPKGEDGWQQTRDTAEMLLREWQKNPTQEAFLTLAAVYNEDTRADEDGLYRDVNPGQAEQVLDDWSFSAERKVGDGALLELSDCFVLVYYAEQNPLSRLQLVCEAELRYEAYRSAATTRIEEGGFRLYPERVVLHQPTELQSIYKQAESEN